MERYYKTTAGLMLLAILVVLNASPAVAWPWDTKPIQSAQLPAVDQVTSDWVADNIEASGFDGKMNRIEGLAKAAQDTANEALRQDMITWRRANEAADTARTALKAANTARTFDFAGKTIARLMRERAMALVVALSADSSTSNPEIQEIVDRLAARRKLTAAQEELAGNLYLNFLESRTSGLAVAPATAPGPAPTVATASAAVVPTNLDSIIAVRVAAAVSGRLASINTDITTLKGQMSSVGAALAVAWGEEPVTAEMMAAVPQGLQLGALATRKAVRGELKWAGKELDKLNQPPPPPSQP